MGEDVPVMADVKTVVRHAIKAVDRHIASKRLAGGNIWRDYILEGTRRRVGEESTDILRNYTTLVNAVVAQRELLASYNIATTRMEEKERLRRTAHSVGLELP